MVGVGLGRGFLSVGRDLPSLNLSNGLPTGGEKGQRERCDLKGDSNQIPYFNSQSLNSYIYISLGS